MERSQLNVAIEYQHQDKYLSSLSLLFTGQRILISSAWTRDPRVALRPLDIPTENKGPTAARTGDIRTDYTILAIDYPITSKNYPIDISITGLKCRVRLATDRAVGAHADG